MNHQNQPAFIKNDLKIGAQSRAKNGLVNKVRSDTVYYIVSVADKKKANRLDDFMKKVLHEPPAARVMLASSFDAPPKKAREKKTKIVKMVMSSKRGRTNEWVWGNIDESEIKDWKDVVYVKVSGLIVYKDKDVFPIHNHYSNVLRLKQFQLVGVDEEGCKLLAARGAKEYFAFTDNLVTTFFNSYSYKLACYYSTMTTAAAPFEGVAKTLAQLDFNAIDNKTGVLYNVGKMMVDAVNSGANYYHVVNLIAKEDNAVKFKADTEAARVECQKLFDSYQMLSLIDYVKLYHNRNNGKQLVISFINQIGV